MNLHRQLGMSLIELMIGLTLVAVVMMVAVPSFTTGVQSRQIRTAAEAIQTGLTLARTEALRRNRNVNAVVDAAGGWTVGCTTPDDTTDANGEKICPTTVQARVAAEGSSNATVAFAEKVGSSTGTAAGTPVFPGGTSATLRFTPLGRVDAATLAGGNVAVFSITNPSGGTCAPSGEMRCLSVVVASNGQIRMCDPAVTTAGDSRACN